MRRSPQTSIFAESGFNEIFDLGYGFFRISSLREDGEFIIKSEHIIYWF